MKYVKTLLNDRGITYIQSRVQSNADMGLSKLVGQLLDLEKGISFTFLPEDIDDSEKYSLVDGSKQIDLDESYECLVDIIMSRLSLSSNCVLLIEDTETEPGNYWVKRNDLRLTFIGKQAYHVLSSTDNSDDRIRTTLSWGGIFNRIGYFSRYDGEIIDRIDSSVLLKIAYSIDFIFSDAYDWDGFVFWERKP